MIALLSACQPATTGGGTGAPTVSAAPASYAPAADEISLDPRNWPQASTRNPSLPPRFADGGLRILGSSWTNGRLRDGMRDGNAVSSSSTHNFVDRTVTVEFTVDGGGKYMALNIEPIGLASHFFSTRNSWSGSRVLPEDTRLVMTLEIKADGSWSQLVQQKSNRMFITKQTGHANTQQLAKLRDARFMVAFGDNHAGRGTSITVYRIAGLETPQEIEAAKVAAAKAAAAPPAQPAKELPKSLDEPMKMLIAGFEDAGAEKLRQAMSSLNRRDLLAISLTEVQQSLLRTNVKELETIVARVALAREAELAKAYDAAPEAEWKAALLKGRVEGLFFYGLGAARSNQPGAVAQAAAKLRQILSQGGAAGVPVTGLYGFPAMLTLAHGLLNGDNGAYSRYVADASLSAADRDAVASLLTVRQNEYMAPVLFMDMQKMRYILGKYAADIGSVEGFMPEPIAFFDINGQPLKAGGVAPASAIAPTSGGGSAPAPAPAPSAPAGKVLD